MKALPSKNFRVICLFYYRPYVQKLIPIESAEYLSNHLNIIAIPEKKASLVL